MQPHGLFQLTSNILFYFQIRKHTVCMTICYRLLIHNILHKDLLIVKVRRNHTNMKAAPRYIFKLLSNIFQENLLTLITNTKHTRTLFRKYLEGKFSNTTVTNSPLWKRISFRQTTNGPDNQ